MTCRSLASLRPPGHNHPSRDFPVPLSLQVLAVACPPLPLLFPMADFGFPGTSNQFQSSDCLGTLPSFFSPLPLVATALPIQVASWAKSTSLRQETPPDTLPQQPESWSPGHLLPCSTVSLILFLKDALRVWGDGLVDKALGHETHVMPNTITHLCNPSTLQSYGGRWKNLQGSALA